MRNTLVMYWIPSHMDRAYCLMNMVAKYTKVNGIMARNKVKALSLMMRVMQHILDNIIKESKMAKALYFMILLDLGTRAVL